MTRKHNLVCAWLSSVICFISATTNGQEVPEATESGGSISIGSIRTSAEAAAIGVLAKYAKNVSEARIRYGTTNFTAYTPDISIDTGENDSFNGVIAKLQGTRVHFRETCVDENSQIVDSSLCRDGRALFTPDTTGLIHTFPFSGGIEADRRFDNVSVLAEAGYAPLYLHNDSFFDNLGLSNKIGIFLQAGYRIQVDDTPSPETGGAVDESEEEPDDEILRIRSSLEWSFKVPVGGLGNLYLEPSATGWYDVANNEFYHQVQAKLRVNVTNDISFDLTFEDGSGAPNFNTGDQFSANLTLTF